jgi:hypothetical protein
MNDAYHIDTHRSLLSGLAILVSLLLVSLHPVFGFSSHSKSSGNGMTPSGSNSSSSSSTSATTRQTPSIKTLASKTVITCVNSTIKNALIDALINRPLVNVNSSIRIDPTVVNHTKSSVIK